MVVATNPTPSLLIVGGSSSLARAFIEGAAQQRSAANITVITHGRGHHWDSDAALAALARSLHCDRSLLPMCESELGEVTRLHERAHDWILGRSDCLYDSHRTHYE